MNNKNPLNGIISVTKHKPKGVFTMLRHEPKQLSFHSELYNKIPENHMLKKASKVVDFSFINDLLADSYCKNFGRPAKEPEMMCKILFLQHLYNLSDERMETEGNLNLVFLYFLGLNPEDKLPDKSLYSKFRTRRVGEETLDEILEETVRQCVEHGLIESDGVSVDVTHIEANTIKKTPERIMKHLARKIMKNYEEEAGEVLEGAPEVPDYKEIEDHNEAKMVMKDYLLSVIDKVEDSAQTQISKTSDSIKKAKEILDDPKFLNQKGLRSLIDEDARVGRKSRTQSFYGYKTEFTMTTKERIITSVRTESGSYMDGNHLSSMLKATKKSGINIKEVFADKAYFRKPLLDELEELKITPYIPVSPLIYRIDESKYTYNKDADEWQCSYGNATEKKKYFKTSNKNGTFEGYKYYFEINQCKTCPLHDECAGKAARKILKLGKNTAEFYDISQYQKTEEFIEKYKERASIEGKIGEVKRFNGLYRARGYGRLSVSKQSKLTAIAANIKRIAALVP